MRGVRAGGDAASGARFLGLVGSGLTILERLGGVRSCSSLGPIPGTNVLRNMLLAFPSGPKVPRQ